MGPGLAGGALRVPLHGPDARDGRQPGTAAVHRWQVDGGRVASLLVEELAALRTPTLILQGERDSVRAAGGGGELHPLAGGAGGVAPQRRPQLQAHPEFGAERGGELGHGGGVG